MSQQFRPDLKDLLDQFSTFCHLYSDLRRRTSDVEAAHRDEIQDLNHVNLQQVQRLEEEKELLQAEMTLQSQSHRDEIRRLEAKHEEDVAMYKRMIENLNIKINQLTDEIANSAGFHHPALHEDIVSRTAPKKKATNSAFKWPELDIQRHTPTTSASKTVKKRVSKKRKLYNPTNQSDSVDI